MFRTGLSGNVFYDTLSDHCSFARSLDMMAQPFDAFAGIVIIHMLGNVWAWVADAIDQSARRADIGCRIACALPDHK